MIRYDLIGIICENCFAKASHNGHIFTFLSCCQSLSKMTYFLFILLIDKDILTRGLNPTYDCFPCQIFTFSKNKTDGKHMVYMDYQVNKMDGDIADKLVIEYISQPIKGEPGQLEFGGVQNGLWHSEQWRIVTFNKEFMIG